MPFLKKAAVAMASGAEMRKRIHKSARMSVEMTRLWNPDWSKIRWQRKSPSLHLGFFAGRKFVL